MANGLVWRLVVATFAGSLVVFGSGLQTARQVAAQSGMGAQSGMKGGMGMMAGADVPRFPAVKGFAEGQEIHFIHSEASDAQVAKMLTDMMGGSPVLVVPSLAKAPAEMLAPVYVFKNGLKGDGPFGFQPDVFEHTPRSPGYRPLRAVHLVTWKDEGRARVLKAPDEVKAAQGRGEVTIERPGIVVNMPMLTWPGGTR